MLLLHGLIAMVKPRTYVWVAEWDKKPTSVHRTYASLINAIASDGYDILGGDASDFEVTATFIYADDYISAHLVPLED